MLVLKVLTMRWCIIWALQERHVHETRTGVDEIAPAVGGGVRLKKTAQRILVGDDIYLHLRRRGPQAHAQAEGRFVTGMMRGRACGEHTYISQRGRDELFASTCHLTSCANQQANVQPPGALVAPVWAQTTSHYIPCP